MERRNFRMDPNLLLSVIERQSGTLGKSIVEGISNSVDAQCSRVKVTLTRTSFTIEDDGRGFTSREEIERFFETFGTPHVDGDAKYGRFRMGRGQIMSFGVNTWRSGPFVMRVDIKHDGLAYDLQESPTPFNGCRIEAELYEPLSNLDFANACKELEDLVTWMEVPVEINGKQANRLPAQAKWDVVNDDAYIRVKKDGHMKLYNMGVLVKSYSPWEFGIGGVVVTKKPLEVNFARNDVLVAKCALWKRIRKTLAGMSTEQAKDKGARLSAHQRDRMAQNLLAGTVRYEDVIGMRLLTDVRKQSHPIEWLFARTARVTVAPVNGLRLGEALHRAGVARVLHPETLERFGVDTVQDLVKRLHKACFTKDVALPECVDFHSVSGAVSDKHRKVEATDLTKQEAVALAAIKRVNTLLVARLFNDEQPERLIHAGKSDATEAWTDGRNYICIERKLLPMPPFDLAARATRLMHILVHEYLHNSPDLDENLHDLEFYEAFHDIVSGSDLFGEVVRAYLSAYASAAKAHGLSVNTSQLRDLDRMEMSAAA